MKWLKKNRAWLIPILLFGLLAPWTPYLDLEISRYFYKGNGQFVSNQFTDVMYNYGILPADIIVGMALCLFIGSYIFQAWKKWRSASLALVLTLAIGSGLIVHAMLKDHWGRPRPKQVIEFGGRQAFRPFYYPNFFHQPEPSKSFSCGHCTMGFYFFALILLGKKEGNRFLFISGVILTLLLGGLLSLTRIMQGGHFFSDVLASALVMWLTALACVRWCYSFSSH